MSSTKLKLLALVSMLVAHFYDYIPEAPLVYGWIGRLAFPLFLFAGVWGFIIQVIEKYICLDFIYLAYYSIWQLVWIIIIQNFHGSGVLNNVDFLYTLTGSIFNLEGGLVFVILGVSLYFTKHSKLSLSIAYLFFVLAIPL